MKNIAVLGSTGSIGKNTVEILKAFPERYKAFALAAGDNVELLASQALLLKPRVLVVRSKANAERLASLLDAEKFEILWGEEGYKKAASHPEVDSVLSAIVGSAGLLPTMAAIEAGKNIALANKESLVMAGELIMPLAREKGLDILPVDSEHSAIFQCLAGQRSEDVSSLLLTASGGPFLNKDKEELEFVRPEDALAHPTWQMGKKISVDSASLMNKGLELIEAMHLFNVPAEKISVVIHPQSIIHSMVAFCDGAVMAQMGIPDMKGAIALALSWPERLPLDMALPSFSCLDLHMEAPDFKKFPCLKIAFDVAREKGIFPAIMNAANEVAVHAFLNGELPFVKIAYLIEKTLDSFENISSPDFESILFADKMARKRAGKIISEL